jgi:hypothetical protein
MRNLLAVGKSLFSFENDMLSKINIQLLRNSLSVMVLLVLCVVIMNYYIHANITVGEEENKPAWPTGWSLASLVMQTRLLVYNLG